MEVHPTDIPGCHEIVAPVHRDERGRFAKVLHKDVFVRHGLTWEFAEEYYSLSRQGVLRGMHFQTPPHAHTKLVYCAAGRVMDVLVDLRAGSPMFGKFARFNLDAERGNALYIAPGVAHGFYVPAGEALMVYKVTSVYAAEHDAGIRWDSAGVPWPDASPILSQRDRGFPALDEFRTPFRYEPGHEPSDKK